MSTETTTPRPTIDFSGSRYETARDHASALVSRINKAESNDILQAIEAGETVDAVAIQRILPDVLSGCATRASNSRARRDDTKRARHLAHIAQAVIESHVDGLPAYAPGDRSRAVETLKGERNEARESALSAQDDVAAAREGLEAARLEIERLTAALTVEKKRADDNYLVADQATEAGAEVTRERDRLVAANERLQAEVTKLSLVIGYTRGLGTAEMSAQSLGYQHGLERR